MQENLCKKMLENYLTQVHELQNTRQPSLIDVPKVQKWFGMGIFHQDVAEEWTRGSKDPPVSFQLVAIPRHQSHIWEVPLLPES